MVLECHTKRMPKCSAGVGPALAACIVDEQRCIVVHARRIQVCARAVDMSHAPELYGCMASWDTRLRSEECAPVRTFMSWEVQN